MTKSETVGKHTIEWWQIHLNTVYAYDESGAVAGSTKIMRWTGHVTDDSGKPIRTVGDYLTEDAAHKALVEAAEAEAACREMRGEAVVAAWFADNMPNYYGFDGETLEAIEVEKNEDAEKQASGIEQEAKAVGKTAVDTGDTDTLSALGCTSRTEQRVVGEYDSEMYYDGDVQMEPVTVWYGPDGRELEYYRGYYLVPVSASADAAR